jgi:hypothetical protein
MGPAAEPHRSPHTLDVGLISMLAPADGMSAAAKLKGTSARPARQLLIRLHQLHDRRKA